MQNVEKLKVTQTLSKTQISHCKMIIFCLSIPFHFPSFTHLQRNAELISIRVSLLGLSQEMSAKKTGSNGSRSRHFFSHIGDIFEVCPKISALQNLVRSRFDLFEGELNL